MTCNIWQCSYSIIFIVAIHAMDTHEYAFYTIYMAAILVEQNKQL
jgi:hypothetical protein